MILQTEKGYSDSNYICLIDRSDWVLCVYAILSYFRVAINGDISGSSVKTVK